MTREEAIKLLKWVLSEGKECEDLVYHDVSVKEATEMAVKALEQTNGDLISKSVFDQIKWERDVAVSQLHDLGYELGEKPKTDGDLAALKCFNIRELKFKDREDAELMKHYLELSFNNLAKLPSYNSIKTELIKTELNGDLISRQAVISMLQKIENAVEDGDGFQFNEWIEYAKDIPNADKTASEKLDDIIVRAEVQNIFDLLTRHTALLNDIKMMLPSAEKTAEWISKDDEPISDWECSNCGFTFYEREKPCYMFCPNCGRRMKEGDTE